MVLEALTGVKEQTKSCRECRLGRQLFLRWRGEFVERAPEIFATERSRADEQEQIVKESGTYFNNARPHQGIDQRIPGRAGLPQSPPTNGILTSRPVLRGLHHTCSRVAAQSVGRSQAQPPACR